MGPGGLGAFDQSTSFTVLRLASVLPAALYLSVAGAPAIGVGQPANRLAPGNFRYSGRTPFGRRRP